VRTIHAAALALVCAATLVACNGDSAAQRALAFHFKLDGPRTSNNTLYYAVGDDVNGDAPYAAAIINNRSILVIEGLPGDAYHVRSEPLETRADERMRWTISTRGTLGAAADAGGANVSTIVAPARARVHVLAPPGMGGPDFVMFYDEKTNAAAGAVRDPTRGLITAAWDSEPGNAYRDAAPARPFILDEFAPGPCVIAARTEGHQWMALRADVGPGAELDMDVGRQPKGGGSVICEDPIAVLLLAGEFPIPAPRLTTELQFRSKWDGVPPGKHKVRYADGRVVDVVATDGETTRIGK